MENNRNRKTGAIFYLIFGVLMILGAAILAVSLSSERGADDNALLSPTPSPTAAEVRLPQATASAIVPAEVLSDNASVIIRYLHTPCGHAYELQIDPQEVAGLSKSDLILRYSDLQVTEFSPEGAILKCTLSSYCPEHYLVKLTDGKLCIFRTKAGSNEQTLIKELGIDLSGIDTEDFRDGVLFDTMEDIESFLENLES